MVKNINSSYSTINPDINAYGHNFVQNSIVLGYEITDSEVLSSFIGEDTSLSHCKINKTIVFPGVILENLVISYSIVLASRWNDILNAHNVLFYHLDDKKMRIFVGNGSIDEESDNFESVFPPLYSYAQQNIKIVKEDKVKYEYIHKYYRYIIGFEL